MIGDKGDKMDEQEMEYYISFMYNRNNEMNCEECPENRHFDKWQGQLPCGQQNCWVTVHCNVEGRVIK